MSLCATMSTAVLSGFSHMGSWFSMGQCDWPSKQLSICMPLSRQPSVTLYGHATGQVGLHFGLLAFGVFWRVPSRRCFYGGQARQIWMRQLHTLEHSGRADCEAVSLGSAAQPCS